jgi:ABC-type cobalamin/Fe3+-siderophores transport system ATPase subunit
MKAKAISLNADVTNPAVSVKTVTIETTKHLPSNPFVGLRPFESEESLLFFGRDKQIKQLLQQLHRTHFVAVVGSSGCGKSSLIRAGVIPPLKGGFLVDNRDRWRVSIMKPGESPLTNLACTLLSTASETSTNDAIANLARDMRVMGTKAITNILAESLNTSGSNMLLVVDQFEELFRYDQPRLTESETTETDTVPADVVEERRRSESALRARRRDEAAIFVSTVMQLAKQTDVPVYVVITMRSDFLGDCDAFHGLPEMINESLYLVPRLNRQQRQQAIENPLRLYGQTITPRLLDLVLNDVGDESDQLPVMEHALMRTWEKWKEDSEKGGAVDLQHYEAAGTMSAALSRDADKALEELSKKDQSIAKRMFQALVETDAQGRNTRRPVHLDQVAQITEAAPAKVLDVVNHFRAGGRSFLTLSTDPATGGTLIDISHESLIRQWAKLVEWLKTENYSKDIYTQLAGAAQRYQKRWRGLLTGTELQLAVDWWKRRQPNEAWALRYNQEYHNAKEFLDESKLKSDQEEQEREQQRLKELETEKIQQQNRRLKKYMYALVSLFIVAIFAVASTAISFVKAKQSADLAIEKGEEADRNRRFAENESRKAIEANRQLELSLGVAQSARDEAERQTRFANLEREKAAKQADIAKSEAAAAQRARQDAQEQADFARRETLRAKNAENLATVRLGQVEQAKLDLQAASKNKEEALKAQKKEVISRLGDLYQKALSLAGDSDTIEDAVKNYEEIRSIYVSEDVRGGNLSTLLVLARLFDGSLDEEVPDRALGYYNQALPLFNDDNLAEKTKKISTLIKMGELLYGESGTQEAAGRFEQAISLGYQPSPDDSRDVYGKLADFYGASTSPDSLKKAAEYYERRLVQLEAEIKASPDSDDPFDSPQRKKLATEIDLATVYMRLGKRPEAKQRYEHALSFAASPPLEESPVDTFVKIALSLNRPEERADRDEYFRKAIDAAPLKEKAGAYKKVGEAFNRLKEPQNAILYLEQAEKLYGAEKSRLAASNLRSLGIIYEALNQKDNAIKYYKRSLDLYEELKVGSAVSSLKRKIATLTGSGDKN